MIFAIIVIIMLILIWIRIPHRGPRKVSLYELLFWLAMGGLAIALTSTMQATPLPAAPPPFQWPAPGAFVQPQHVEPQRPLIQTPPGVEPDPLANPALHLTPL